MVIRNRLFAFLYRLLTLGVGIYSLILLFTGAVPTGVAGFGFLSFGIQATLFATGVLVAEIIANGIGLRKRNDTLAPGVWSPVFFAALTYLLASSLAYAVSCPIMYGVYFKEGEFLMTLFSRILFPALYFLDYLLFGEKGTVKWIHPVYWVIYPVFFFAMSLLCHYIWKFAWYPYPFLDCVEASSGVLNKTIWGNIWITGVVFLASYLLLSFLMVFLNSLLAGVYRKRDSRDFN